MQAALSAAPMASQAVTSAMPPPSQPIAPTAPVVAAPTAPTVTAPPAPAGMDPSTKVMLGLAGTQALSGMMGGVFQGHQASDVIAQREEESRKAQSQTQQQIDQAEKQRAWERQNASYAPVVKFSRGAGLLAAAGRS